MNIREPTLSLFCDEEVRGTTNVNPDIRFKGFEHNSTYDEYSFDKRSAWLLVPTKPDISKSINEWQVGFPTNMDIIKKWLSPYSLSYSCFLGYKTDIISTDTTPTNSNIFMDISPEIKELSQSNALFNDVLTTALSEISFLLDKEMDKLNYQIKVKIEEDFEIPEWKVTLISIKVPERNPEDLIRLWKVIEERVGKKIESIKKENEDEINKINENLVIVIE